MTEKKEVQRFKIQLALEATQEAVKCIEYAGYKDVARRYRRDIENFQLDIQGLKIGTLPFVTLIKDKT